MISGPDTITGHLNGLIEDLQAGDDDQARMRAHQALFDLQRLRAIAPDRSKRRSDVIISAIQEGVDLGKVMDLDRDIRAVLKLLDSEQLDAALEECTAARDRWLAPIT
jgi:hypothetical protein